MIFTNDTILIQQDININEKGTETHYSLKESEKMRILENELSATKYELAATQKIMADAKQNISDLKWENKQKGELS